MRAAAVTPILNVSDFPASVEWFGKLGWSPGFSWQPPGETAPTFGAVRSGDLEVFLCLNGQGGRGGDGGMWMSIWVADATGVDEAYDNCLRSGLEVLREPQNEPWDIREMQVRHPDGHVFRISAPIGHSH